MSYTVVWTANAERVLTELWLASHWRHLITASADQIDVLLAERPNDAGESRDANRRIVFAPPLAAEFDVDETVRTVYVRTVWQIPQGRF